MYAPAKDFHSTYGKMANADTNPIRQIVMLYDGAIKFLNLSAADIESKDFAAKAEHSTRAFDIINYLQSILDFERGGEVAVSLDNLYRRITVLALNASAKPDAAMMRRAAELLTPVRDAWETNARASSPRAFGMSLPVSENGGSVRLSA